MKNNNKNEDKKMNEQQQHHENLSEVLPSRVTSLGVFDFRLKKKKRLQKGY